MYIIRETFTAKPGNASKLAKMFKKSMGNARVMTDLVGQYNTVVVEREINSLAEFEKEMEDYRAGKNAPKMDKEAMKEMSKYTQMYLFGKREIFRVEE